jgi:hypothetical protein
MTVTLAAANEIEWIQDSICITNNLLLNSIVSCLYIQTATVHEY